MEARIRRNIIILIVVTFLLLVGMSAGWFFVLVRPQKEEIDKTAKSYETLKEKASKLGANLEKKQKAEDRYAYLQEQIAFFQNRYRSFNFGDLNNADANRAKAERNRTWLRLMKEYNAAFGITLRDQLINAANVPPRVSINVNPLPTVIKPPAIPEEVSVPANGLIKPAGVLNVTVRGSFPEILAFFERVNEISAPRQRTILLLVGNVKLEGTSPNITASFTVTPYMLGAGPSVDFKGAQPAPPPAPAAPPGGGPGPGPAPAAGDGGGAEEAPAEKGGLKNRGGDGGGDQ